MKFIKILSKDENKGHYSAGVIFAVRETGDQIACVNEEQIKFALKELI